MEDRPSVDKSSPIPLYYQLRRILEDLIRTHAIKPGEPIPDENGLCERYGVSRTTVRQTISEMLKDGVLYRKKPRARPIVAPVVVHQSLLKLQGFFTIDTLTAGLTPHTEVVSVEKQSFPSIAAKLGLPKESVFYRVERVHYGDEEPFALQISYIPYDVSPNLAEYDLTGSLFKYLEQDTHERIATARQSIRIEPCGNYEQTILRLPHRFPLFRVERVSFIGQNRPVEYFECLLRSDRYDFEMELDR